MLDSAINKVDFCNPCGQVQVYAGVHTCVFLKKEQSEVHIATMEFRTQVHITSHDGKCRSRCTLFRCT